MMRLRRFVWLCAVPILVLALNASALDDEKVAKRLVEMVPADSGHRHPEYYTGTHHFMNEEDVQADNGGPLEAGLYIMSWLVLDPPIVLGAGGGAASINKDLLEEYVGIKEDSLTIKNSKNWPRAGQKAKNPSQGIGSDGMWWIPINFQDLWDAGQGTAASGNQFDWLEWGGQGLNQFHEYGFTLAMWNKGGTVTFRAGSDDPEQTWVDGVLVCQGLADRNWTADTDVGEIEVPGGVWVPILFEVGENGGECGYTLEVNPPPDDVTLDVDTALSVNPRGKLPTIWGSLKSF
ncbi:MAG: hypothetical protein KatS3mg115_0669 [Candidatus Poribacteria bacterium]|nr:MAG: hypothetical protein KatS3mg115_0669 [Candidatus Poribacteria bacterium]